MSRTIGLLLILALLLWDGRAWAGSLNFAFVQHYVFVPGEATETVAVIDIENETLAGTVGAGLIPLQIVASTLSASLLAIDGVSPRLAMIDLVTGLPHDLTLTFPPTRLVLSQNGRMLAAANPETGGLALIDLSTQSILSQVSGLLPFGDLIFSADATRLYLAEPATESIAILRVPDGGALGSIETKGAVASFTRAPDGRSLFGREADGAAIDVVDLARSTSRGRLALGLPVRSAYPSAFGTKLLIPDQTGHGLSIVAADSLQLMARLPGGNAMGIVYPAWFDTVAFVPSVADGTVWIYDLDTLAPKGTVILEGTAGPGSVTADGASLYLPLKTQHQIVLIDVKTRTIAKTITVPIAPTAAIIAGGFGLCH